MSTEDSRISIYDLKDPDEDRDPRLQRSDEQIERLKTRFDENGWLSPIVFTSDELLIVDGNTRINALKQFDDEGDYEFLQILGEFQGYTFAVPDTDVDIGPEEAAAELNIYRENLTDADRTTYLDWLVKSRIIDSDEFHVARDVSTTELLSQLESDRDWEFSEEAKTELEELLSVMDFESPEDARNHISLYHRAPEPVQELWILDEINYSHFEELTRIHERMNEGKDLSDTPTRPGHEFDDLVEYSREDDYRGQDEYYTRGDLRDIVNKLEEQGSPGNDDDDDDDEDDTPTTEELKKKLSDDQIEELKELIDIFRERYEIDSWEDLFEYMVDNYDRYQSAIADLQNHKKYLEKREDLDSYDWDSSQAERNDSLHLARPLEAENLHCFFHSCTEMEAEIDAKEVDLFVFSPPYFTQRGTIPAEEWYAGEGPVDTKQKLDEAYRDFLEAMKQVFTVLHKHLAQGGHIVFVVSDIQSAYEGGDTKPRYDVPSDLSHLIRAELNPDYSKEEKLNYENTIVWEKGYGTGAEKFIQSGDPTNYRPNDTTERVLVYRKGSKTSTVFSYPSPDEFREYFDSLWQIHPDSDGPHPASYPVELVKPLVQLYSSPGDTVADPMVGGGTTLRALWELNAENNSTPPRTGYAWENFASEDYDDVNYWKQIYLSFMHTELGESDILSGLDAFTMPLSV